MKRKLIVITDALDPGHQKQIRQAAEQNGFEALFFADAAQALPFLADAEIVFGASETLAKNSPRLRWLCTPYAGVDSFTAPGTFASPDAVLTNSSGAYGVAIAEHIVMAALAMLRRQPDYSAIVSRREWRRDLPVRSLQGSRITLLGTGDIGRETAARLRAFGPARLVGVNRSGKDAGGLFDRVLPQSRLEEALPAADLLVVSLPGTKETYHMLDARRLSLLPDQALVINVGRGAVIDQKALEAELRAGRLYAALDVFEQEPIPPDDPLWDCPNLLITPHMAGNTALPCTRDRIVKLFLEDFENYCAGRPLKRLVDRARGY